MKELFFSTNKNKFKVDIIQLILNKITISNFNEFQRLVKEIIASDFEMDKSQTFRSIKFVGLDEESTHYIKSR